MTTPTLCGCECDLWRDHDPAVCEKAAVMVRRSRPGSAYPVDVCGPCARAWDVRMLMAGRTT